MQHCVGTNLYNIDNIDVENVRNDDTVFDGGQNDKKDMVYTVEQTPPWYICGLLGFQVFIV